VLGVPSVHDVACVSSVRLERRPTLDTITIVTSTR